MKSSSPTILALWAMGLISSGFFGQQAQAQGPITGNITWGGSVELNDTSAATATGVILNGWHGGSTTPIVGAPQVQSRDGDFIPFVAVGDGTAFASPWSFNSGAVSGFWSVGGFTFDLASSTAVQGGTPGVDGFALVTGAGTVSGNGFLTTPGTFRFSTQDPGAGTPTEFSFSASTAVPEGSTIALLGIGGVCLVAGKLRRRKAKAG
jgi:hypothetical protein